MGKKIDSITALLWSFIFFLAITSIYLVKIDKHIKEYSEHHDLVSELEILNKEFDNFLLKKSTFINYDFINNEIISFEKYIEYLNSELVLDSYSQEYTKHIKQIIKSFKLKYHYIEYFKSQNSQLLDSLHYLFDLNAKINKSQTIDKKSINIVNDTYLNLMKFYVNDTISTDIILNNLQFLKSQLKKEKSFEIDMFINHTEINLKRISGFNEILKFQNINTLDVELNKLHTYLDMHYQKNSVIQKTIVVLLFIIIAIILSMLMISFRRSLKMKDELLGFKTAIENSYNSIVITDPDSNITYVNDVAQKETGYTKEELIGQNPRILKSGANSAEFYNEMHKALNSGKKWDGEFVNKRKDGSFYHEKASIMPIFQNNKLVNYLAIKLNITDYIEAKREVEHMAYHDSLTSLPNRANIENYLENRLKVASRQDTKIALLFIDLDRFKNINDTLGHDIGDELLIEVSKRLKLAVRKSDMLSRFGGDEFAVVIDGLDDNYYITHICEKIINSFHKPIQTKQHLLNITLSIGISIFPNDANDITTLLKYADIAMYKAKTSGKNTYRYYQKELSVNARSRFDMEQALKIAMNNNEFYMVYQPQYKLKDKTIIGLEALVRWNAKTLGLVGPDKFIPICEDIGYILELGLFIFKQSCIDFLIFKKSCQTLRTLSINISAIQLYQDKFIDDIMKIVDNVGIKTNNIVLEITETHIMKNVIHSMTILEKLKKLGFNISIDDFGTGHSSLSYLKRFPINELKIDKSFIDNLPNDKDDVSIVKAVLSLSNNMEYINVAEGIENIVQEQFLIEHGCQIGQGYYFSKPQTKDNLISFFQKRFIS